MDMNVRGFLSPWLLDNTPIASDVEKLLADYGLEACDSPTENSNRFLDYIGEL